MIKPEMKLIKMLEWKHKGWFTSPDQTCSNTQVAMVKYLHPETKKLLELQVVCTQCGRSLSITNYEQT